MSTFAENDRFSLDDYEIDYHNPTASNSAANLKIIEKATGIIQETYDLIDEPLGLQIDGNDLLVGLSDHGTDNEFINMDLSLNASLSSFLLGGHPVNGRMGGIGLEDLRDASRTGTKNTHYFHLDVEPINISFSNSSGLFVVEMRNRSTKSGEEDSWYAVTIETV